MSRYAYLEDKNKKKSKKMITKKVRIVVTFRVEKGGFN